MLRNFFGKKGPVATKGEAVKKPAPQPPTRLPPDDPFVNKDPSKLDILIRVPSPWTSPVYGREASETSPGILEAIKNDFGDKKATIHRETIHGEVQSNTMALPGYRILAMPPKMGFSRDRNLEADLWFRKAHEEATAIAYLLEVPDQLEQYWEASSNSFHRGLSWEQDRFEIAQILRRADMIENPNKPFLLLIHKEESDSDENDLDVERLINLLGLANISRPFRVAIYSTTADKDSGALKEALGWLAQVAQSKDCDESTANMTGTTDTEEEEGSVATSTSTALSIARAGGHYVLDYEPTLLGGNPALQRFLPIQKGTHCPFAKAAKLWGGKLVDEHRPRMAGRADTELEEAVTLNAGPLAEFVARSNNGEPLDGYVFDIPNSQHCYTVERLGETVCKILTKLAELDPTEGENAMKMGPVDHPHWRFRFAGEDFFVTTFAPCYEQFHSRYAHGSNRSFVLFQPMTSFGRHGLLKDTPASATNWENPTTMRDKARVAFRKNGCPYHIPETLPYPVSEHVVKPQLDDGSSVVRWWEPMLEESGKTRMNRNELNNKARAWMETLGVEEEFLPPLSGAGATRFERRKMQFGTATKKTKTDN